MSAFSGGRLLSINDDVLPQPVDNVVDSHAEARATAPLPQPSPAGNADETSSALSTIIKMIPGDGIALYITFYSFFVALAAFEKVTPLNLLIGFGLVVVAVAGTVAFTIAGAMPAYRRLRSEEKRKARRGQIAGTAALYAGLCVVYIAASPLNPFLLYWKLPLVAGAIAAVAAVAIIAVVRKLRQTAKG